HVGVFGHWTSLRRPLEAGGWNGYYGGVPIRRVESDLLSVANAQPVGVALLLRCIYCAAYLAYGFGRDGEGVSPST
ncbi:MAG: hypothetical protein QW680_13110, partial [Pyrobaculum sp.]